MKFVKIFLIFLISFLTAEALKYEITLTTSSFNFMYEGTQNVEGKLLATVYGSNLKKNFNFTFNELSFGEPMKVKNEFEFDDEIVKIFLRLKASEKKTNILIVGPMRVANLTGNEIITYHQECKYLDGKSFILFKKPGYNEI